MGDSAHRLNPILTHVGTHVSEYIRPLGSLAAICRQYVGNMSAIKRKISGRYAEDKRKIRGNYRRDPQIIRKIRK